jgi:hypothetical protein
MAVKYIGQAQDLCGLNGCAAEEAEALGIVGIVACRGAVKRIALEERGIVDEVKLHAGLAAAIEH